MIRMRFAERAVALVLVFTCCVAQEIVAQEIYATLLGTVTDTSGAVVPGASVLVHNDATNTDVRTVTTDANGDFTVTNLPAGTYTVNVKLAGFKTFSASNVVLNVAQKRSLPVQLETGQISETVNVAETAVAVQTASAAQMGTISGTQVRELQLNNRNFQQLVTLQPGVVSGFPDVINFGISNTTNVVVNGARNTSNNWTVDGADINDSGSNGTLLNVPSVDAIQEFTLARSSYDAQYGRSGGAQVIVATKSGTDQFHGDLYEFVRNDYFNANNFFANRAGRPRPPLRYNDYGFTVGGPLFIPKLYKRSLSKTYFFWSEEWRKTGQPSTFNATVPTATQLNGTFAGNLTSLTAPAGCLTYNGSTTQISPACFSNNARVYNANVYSRFPGNAANGTQYISNVVSQNNYRQDLVRLDQNITEKVHIFGRFIQDIVPTTEPGGLFAGEPLPGISSTATNAPGKNVVANVSWAISPTVVNEAAYNYSWGAITSTATGVTNSPAFLGALAGGLPYTDPYGRIPGVTISGFTGLALPAAPYNERNIDKNFYDNFSKVVGSHTVRAGVTVQWLTKTENGPTGSNGTFSFQTSAFPGTTTSIPGSAFANFLLGNVDTFTQASRDIIPHLNYTNVEAYMQDDWKISPRLTVNLGVRYSYFPTPSDSNNLLNNFDPLLFNPANAPRINPANGNFIAGQSVVPSTYVNGIIFPQGGACAAAQTIAPVTCSPYGSKVNPNSNNNWGPRVGFAFDPSGNGKTAIRAGYGIYYDRTLNGLWEQNAFTEPPILRSTTITNTSFDRPLGGTNTVPLGPASFDTSGTPAFKVPSYQDWNFSIEQQLFPSTVFQIAYVGTKGTHLLGEIDANQPTLATRQANPTVNVNAVRPYVGYSYFKTRTADFNSNYNSLQVSLNRRVSNGLNLGVSYTWSKNLSDNPADRDAPLSNTYDYRYSYGPASLNTPHIFIANYVYNLPFFKDQRGVLGHVLGGWELSGITTVESGQSLTVRQGPDPFNAGSSGNAPGTYPGGIGINADTAIAPRADLVPGQSLDGPKTVSQWFNTGAFTNAVGHFGTAGRGILLGPHLQNWDMSGIRNFKFGERISMQFRGEFFNVFNHTNFTQGGLVVNTASASFGQVTAAHNPRNIQLGLKLYF